MNRFEDPCANHREDLCLLASGALAEAESAASRRHLAACAGCRRYFDELKSLTAPLVDWEGAYSHVRPDPAQQARWANAIQQVAAAHEPDRTPASSAILLTLWRELIRPCRRAWAAMAVLWVIMCAIHFGSAGDQISAARPITASVPFMWQTFEDQQLVLADLLEPFTRETAEPARQDRTRPRPHSQNRTRWQIG